ncbi:MAG: hypothetical protein WB507_05650 [Solirubrobacterales bacterium]
MRTPTHKLKATIGVIGLILTVGLGASAALAAAPGGAAPPGSEPKLVPDNHYVDPFAAGGWSVSRTDMGVDYVPIRREPVVAIGDAKIIGSSTRSGWPGGSFLWYRLLDGSHAGEIIYVAEHLANLAPEGATVAAGQRIATALPGYPWTEWGWATPAGQPRAFPCYREGMETNSGREMARFLDSLGARPLRRLQPGPDWPSGRRC